MLSWGIIFLSVVYQDNFGLFWFIWPYCRPYLSQLILQQHCRIPTRIGQRFLGLIFIPQSLLNRLTWAELFYYNLLHYTYCVTLVLLQFSINCFSYYFPNATDWIFSFKDNFPIPIIHVLQKAVQVLQL